MKALIIGATGATGKPLMEQLLNSTHFSQVTVFVRRALELSHPKLRVEVIDFDRSDTWSDKVCGDVLFSCLGTTLKQAGGKDEQYRVDYTYQYQFADIAKRNGVEYYVLVSSAMANIHSKYFYLRLKGELEEAVMTLQFPHVAILRPPMLKRPNSNRFGEVLGEKILENLNGFGLLLSQKPLPTADLASAMIQTVLQNKTGILQKQQIWQLAKA